MQVNVNSSVKPLDVFIKSSTCDSNISFNIENKNVTLNVGRSGLRGFSEYEISVRNGLAVNEDGSVMTESEWLNSRLGVLPPELEERIKCLEENDGEINGQSFLARYILTRDN